MFFFYVLILQVPRAYRNNDCKLKEAAKKVIFFSGGEGRANKKKYLAGPLKKAYFFAASISNASALHSTSKIQPFIENLIARKFLDMLHLSSYKNAYNVVLLSSINVVYWP